MPGMSTKLKKHLHNADSDQTAKRSQKLKV